MERHFEQKIEQITWTPLAGDPTEGDAYCLFADPANPNRIITFDYSTLYFSGNGGSAFNARFSDQGGNGLYVAGAFFDGQNNFVGASAGLLVSSNGGATFAAGGPAIPSGEALVSFAGAKSGGVTRFFIVTCPAADLYPGILIEDLFGLDNPLNVYSLDWGGTSWTLRNTGLDSSHRLVFVGAALNDISTVWLAGGTYGEDFPAVYKSTNGGANWTAALLTSQNQNVATGWAGDGGDRGWGYGGGIVGFAVAPNDCPKLLSAITDSSI